MESTLKDLTINELKSFLNKMRIKFGSKNYSKAFYIAKVEEGLTDAKSRKYLPASELALLEKKRRKTLTFANTRAASQMPNTNNITERHKVVKSPSILPNFLKEPTRFVKSRTAIETVSAERSEDSIVEVRSIRDVPEECCKGTLFVLVGFSSFAALFAFLYFYKPEETKEILRSTGELLSEGESQVLVGISAFLIFGLVAHRQTVQERAKEREAEEFLNFLLEGERTLFSREDLFEMAREKNRGGAEELVSSVEALLDLSERFRTVDSVSSIWMRLPK